jgi:hypothetical protein
VNTDATLSASIAAQPSPSAAVNKFLALKPRLFIDGEWRLMDESSSLPWGPQPK